MPENMTNGKARKPPAHLQLQEKTSVNNKGEIPGRIDNEDTLDALFANPLFAHVSSSASVQGSEGSPHNIRPASTASSTLSTLSPTSSSFMGRDDPFICGGVTPNYVNNLNVRCGDNNGSPTSDGGGSEQQSPQYVTNQPFGPIHNGDIISGGLDAGNVMPSQPHPDLHATSNCSPTSYNCYDSLSDSDGERNGPGDSGNDSSSSHENQALSPYLLQEGFDQHLPPPPTSSSGEVGAGGGAENENCDLDVIARALYSHPTIQAVSKLL